MHEESKHICWHWLGHPDHKVPACKYWAFHIRTDTLRSMRLLEYQCCKQGKHGTRLTLGHGGKMVGNKMASYKLIYVQYNWQTRLWVSVISTNINERQFPVLQSHQVFSVLADIVPLWTCEAVLAFHYHSHHYQLLAMPEWRTANEPKFTHHVNMSSISTAKL